MDFSFFIVPFLGVIGLLFMVNRARWVLKQDSGDEKMKKISLHIQRGALTFLKAEWRLLAIFVAIAAALLFWLGLSSEHSSPVIAIAFVIGAFFSALAGYIGMCIATRGNVRTTQAARSSLKAALEVAFTGGLVMGVGVASLAILGLGGLFLIFYWYFILGGEGNGTEMIIAIESLTGFSLGAESIALFSRVGGGIFTKAADVGADLVGKIEAGIPEDDIRNPATIADNVGDNVGDVAGMGADLFGSYVATMLATMVLGREIFIQSEDTMTQISPILLPMMIGGLGLLFSMIASYFVRVKGDSGNILLALNKGNWLAILMTVVGSWFLIQWLLPSGLLQMSREGSVAFSQNNVFGAAIVGLLVGGLISYVTEYYTSKGRRPVMSIVSQSSSGAATNVIAGLGVGMESTFLPIIILATGIVSAYACAGSYGVAIAATAMMSTTAMQLAIDAFGAIADNAGGIAEMSGLPKEVRERTDALDAVGNTTAATGKGFAIASAALTSLALFAAFAGLSGIDSIDLYKAPVLAALFIGGMIPFIFSSLCISAVGRAAWKMVNEVRRQFREIPGILEYKTEPEYEKCIDIATEASLKEMILPGAIALCVPP
ncbi:MAG: V-type H(+)-translocating pyrophosphatase, partial [Lentisphaeraceae bacterium]|nr:V-type H(+)-translocating pyrophosphatase [Lentisphaeraceae bacterium]